MKLIIAGSRGFQGEDCYQLLGRAIEAYRPVVTEVVCGEAPGADRLGKRWAIENGIAVRSMPADWDSEPKTAGFTRNRAMGDYAMGLFYCWDGRSPGTKQMIEYMNKLGKPNAGIVYQFVPYKTPQMDQPSRSITWVPRGALTTLLQFAT